MKKFMPLGLLAFACGMGPRPLQAQGLLPNNAASVETSSGSQKPILIGDTVPDSLLVIGPSGDQRTLLSYKSAVDVFVVVFFSTACSMNSISWPAFRRLEETYKGWHVSFIALSVLPHETTGGLSEMLSQNHLPWPVARDEQGTVARRLNVAYTPEVVILDEFGVLRYRGGAADAGKALDTIIGHSDTIQVPEPTMTAGCLLL
jgi:hypothetical protein